ncbi:hypothetical protein [Acuticoccus sp. I52.16.1]|uniref:hypothetical protein n=1 Tax=Acuticoccus sp. I52.16.1 TaxID=2928472 RepID=UPI001FD32CA5|nr:hypothetical protein [Acuticoccus sp. I52.16.1]UOM35876.1 hypothetical protein MRB58_06655 [Acuticoccus sp. I52.16.1]
MSKLGVALLIGAALLLSGCISGDWSGLGLTAAFDDETCRSDGVIDVCQDGGDIRVTDNSPGARTLSEAEIAERTYDLIDTAALPVGRATPGFSLGATDLSACSVGTQIVDGNTALLTCRLTMVVSLE